MLTDDDLKILRKLRFNALTKVNFYIPTDKFDYLLARLDAAEKVAERAVCDCMDLEYRDCRCGIPELQKAWLASKGQKEGA